MISYKKGSNRAELMGTTALTPKDLDNNDRIDPDADPGIDFENFVLEDELKKYEGIKTNGWNILIRVYSEKREIVKKTKGGIFLPNAEKITDEAGYKNCTGLVVQKSIGAYKDERYKDTGEWCKVGDWVVFPRHAGYRIEYKKIPMFVLKEDQIDLVVDDPRLVSK